MADTSVLHIPLLHELLKCTVKLAERLALIRQQRAEAAKKREEEKAGIISEITHNLFCILSFIFSGLFI